MSCHCPLNNLELDVRNASSPRRAGELVVLPLALESDAALGVALPSYSKTKLFTFSTATYPKLGCCALPPAAKTCPRERERERQQQLQQRIQLGCTGGSHAPDPGAATFVEAPGARVSDL